MPWSHRSPDTSLKLSVPFLVLFMTVFFPAPLRASDIGLAWVLESVAQGTNRCLSSWNASFADPSSASAGSLVPIVTPPISCGWAYHQSAELSVAEARILTRHELGISFRRLETLHPLVARELSRYGGSMHFDSLAELDPRAANFLVGDQPLRFPSLRRLSPEVARAFARHRGVLALDAVAELTDEAAEYLSRHEGFLTLNGVTDLTVRAADALSRHQGPICLNGLADPSPAVIALLARSSSGLALCGVRQLDDVTAADLGHHAGPWLMLDGIDQLSRPAVESLGRHRSDISVGMSMSQDAVAFSRWTELRRDAVLARELRDGAPRTR